ncbi:MAG: hypothetical protein AVDCRST_MAG42-1707 [uncultured Chthoniobacterales bacterium]|uniref:Uncharacterized protein n=1 Tax=uncultured Chthoniobacterales bacterium TaxID=1836801 RepID=A0A6J4I455_9BACT|nr:MAG: hypothetical protein AVDCRST_MAG42-1707 [uncultured Chthoniobacterales bacterium]
MVVVVVPVAPPTAGVAVAGAVEACTSIIEELSVALLVAGAGSGAVVLAALAGTSKSEGLESGAGELSCARETDVAMSNAVAPQTNWLRRVNIDLRERLMTAGRV